jgi:hypothetical protein
MPIYTFKLRDGGGVEHSDRIILLNDKIAYRHARGVVGELMDHQEDVTRYWRLDVYRDNGDKVFDILFAELDQTLDHLGPGTRALVELNAQRRRALRDAHYEASITRREAQALVARSRGKPYLAADHGRNVIR